MLNRIIPLIIMSAFGQLEAGHGGGKRKRTGRPINRTPRGSYAGTSFHPIRTELRANRAANAARNFATGHWQYRTVDASAS
jgi:hypothetical protein